MIRQSVIIIILYIAWKWKGCDNNVLRVCMQNICTRKDAMKNISNWLRIYLKDHFTDDNHYDVYPNYFRFNDLFHGAHKWI